MEEIKYKKTLGGDRPLWVVFLLLSLMSILVIYSSTVSMAYRTEGGDTSYYLIRQVIFVVSGFIVAYLAHRLKPSFYIKHARFWFVISLILTFLVYTPLGTTINQASRWLEIPFVGITIMPSDLLKVTLVLLLAKELGKRQGGVATNPILPTISSAKWNKNPGYWMFIIRQRTIPLVVPIVMSVAAVMWANLSTALIILFFSCIILAIGRVRRRDITRLLSTMTVCFVVVVLFMQMLGIGRSETWVNRGKDYLYSLVGVTSENRKSNTDDDFQKTQAKIAIASGGIMGKGPGNSTQRSQLPHPYSDFAYAFIVEEYGLVGAIMIIAMYLWILYRGIVIMRKCYSVIESMVVMGLALIIICSAFVNICVSTGIAPVTGQSLPMISLGGTSIIITAMSFGMILGISRKNEQLTIKYAAQRLELEEKQRLEAEAEVIRLRKQEEVYGEDFRNLDPISSRMHARKVNERYGIDSSVVWDGRGTFGVRDEFEEGSRGGDKEIVDL